MPWGLKRRYFKESCLDFLYRKIPLKQLGVFFLQLREAFAHGRYQATGTLLLEKILKIFIHHSFQGTCRLPYPFFLTVSKASNLISVVSYDCCCMVELCISITRLYPFFPGSLKPKKFLLIKNKLQLV